MKKAIAVDGATTSHGGIIKATQNKSSTDGRYWLREDDGFLCPKCSVWSSIIRSNTFINVHGKYVAMVSDKLTCGAIITEPLQHRTFAGDNNQMIDNSYFNIADDLANTTKQYKERFQLIDDNTGLPLRQINYRIKLGEKIVAVGITDDDGYTKVIECDNMEQVEVEIGLTHGDDDAV
ncbi:PAAR domain-containing protein [Faucicola boevrei]|uniref:PAAR domain-containing protein n=1 Tax=Faucicola boevrei TaxID=346665 RepID=UPI000370CC69|nr:PAAR domain-containing protein [Moraxella boevrei]